MEVTKYKAQKSALEKAREEFDAFRRKADCPAVTVSASAAAVSARPPERVFHCATKTGMRARLVLTLTAETAEVIAVRPAALGDYIEKASSGPQEAVLTRRRLILGVYGSCPHCARTGLVLCSSCGALSCLGPDESAHRCPPCGRTAGLSFGGISLGFSAPSARTYTTAPGSAVQAVTRQTEPKLLPRNPVHRLTYRAK